VPANDRPDERSFVRRASDGVVWTCRHRARAIRSHAFCNTAHPYVVHVCAREVRRSSEAEKYWKAWLSRLG
jgi:hypothetical protein